MYEFFSPDSAKVYKNNSAAYNAVQTSPFQVEENVDQVWNMSHVVQVSAQCLQARHFSDKEDQESFFTLHFYASLWFLFVKVYYC